MARGSKEVLVAVVDAFRGAIRDRDAAAAEGLCTADGWIGRDDAAGRYFRRVSRAELTLGPITDARINGDRASVRFTEGTARFCLCVREPDRGWRVEAVTDREPRSGLFLRGALGALVGLKQLPESEEAAGWGRTMIAAGASWAPEVWPSTKIGGESVEKLRQLASGRGVRVDRLGAVGLDVAGRAAVGLSFSRRGVAAPDEVWVVLERDPSGRYVVHHLAWVATIDALLDGYDLPWTGDPADRAAPSPPPSAPADVDKKQGFTADQLEWILAAAAGRLAQAGGGSDTKSLADDVRRRFRARLDTRVPRPQPPAPVKVDVEGAVRSYVADKVGSTDVTVDRKFLVEHGRGLLGSMMGAFAKAMVPSGLDLTVPPPEAGGAARDGEEARRGVTVDIADLVRSVVPKTPPDDDRE